MSISSFELNDINAELSAMCDYPESSSMDMVEDEGYMIPNGFHVEQDLNYLVSKPSNAFYDSRLSAEENALLNMEVTPYIEEILYRAAEEKGTLPEPLVEDEIDDEHQSIQPTVDREARLNEAIPLFDKYLELSEKIDKACQHFGWSELSAARDMAWSIFKEEMDYNWLSLDLFDDKIEKRMIQLAAQGQEPDENGWNRFLEMRDQHLKRVKAIQRARYPITRKFYDRAQTLTKQCRDFWKTAGGKVINQLREEKKELYKVLTTKVDGYSCWDFVSDYWKLRQEEISKSYLSSNDNAGVDDPEQLNLLRDTIVGLSESHCWENMKAKKSDTHWNKWYSRFLDYSLGLANQGQSWWKYGGEMSMSAAKQKGYF